ncbi:MAG: TrmH family RNA methyltransferase [Bacteroidota bacterium]
MKILLYAPEYRPNLSNMIRSAEFFGFKEIYIYDKNELLSPPKNKATRADMNHMARVWTAGAIEFIEVNTVANPISFVLNHDGRAIATELDTEATHLQSFTFLENDLIIMGSEKEGLPVDFIEACDERVYIPSQGNTSCLNVSVSLGILLYAASIKKFIG